MNGSKRAAIRSVLRVAARMRPNIHADALLKEGKLFLGIKC